MTGDIKLTQFSPGAGCGCKISPAELEKIIGKLSLGYFDKNLLVGYNSKDDAAVYDLGNGKALISTTDFFTPVVDDPFDYGRIAATNAISDIYAMGGKPFLALAILGWPLSRLPAEEAGVVLAGAKQVCNKLGVSLAGGHSIDISEPVFGLAVNGIADIDNIRQNNTATAGCRIFLTKPLGIGILTTAMKKAILSDQHKKIAVELMCSPNSIGYEFGKYSFIKAMTDVTGFGLLGHLLEICEGSRLEAVLYIDSIPVIPGVYDYTDQNCIPGGTHRNWKSYNGKIAAISELQKLILCDPQTSGGLLIAVEADGINEIKKIAENNNIELFDIGYLSEKTDISGNIIHFK